MYKTNEDNGNGTGWGVGVAAIIGAAAGYWAGKANGPNNGYVYGAAAPAVVAAESSNNCRTCYQQGVESGQSMAGLNFIAQQSAANASNMREYFTQTQAQFQAIQMQFANLSTQKIADLQNEVNALRTQQVVSNAASVTNVQLASLNDKVSSIVTGCGVRSYPGCPTTSCGCVTTSSAV